MKYSLPVIVERDEDGMYIVECPAIPGCYTQGRTKDEAFDNLQDVIALALEEEGVRADLKDYVPTQITVQTITVEL